MTSWIIIIDTNGEGLSFMYELNKTLPCEDFLLYDGTEINESPDKLKLLIEFLKSENFKLAIVVGKLKSVDLLRKDVRLLVLDTQEIVRKYSEDKKVRIQIIDSNSDTISQKNADLLIFKSPKDLESRKKSSRRFILLSDFWQQELKKYLTQNKKRKRGKNPGMIGYYSPKY